MDWERKAAISFQCPSAHFHLREQQNHTRLFLKRYSKRGTVTRI